MIRNSLSVTGERVVDVVATARRSGVPIVWVRTEHDRWTDSAAWLGAT